MSVGSTIAKICRIYSSEVFIVRDESFYRKIVKCADLSELYDENSVYFVPYNDEYKNPNLLFDVFVGLDNIFTELIKKHNDKGITMLLVELGEAIIKERFEDNESACKMMHELKGLYEILGLEFVEENDGYSVKVLTDGFAEIERATIVESWLKQVSEEGYDAYIGALDAFSAGNYGTSIESCRTTLTSLFSLYKGVDQFSKWIRGVAVVSEEYSDTNSLKENLNSVGKNDLAEFFEENRDGDYKKTRAIYSIYSMMSDYGTHRGESMIEKPTKEDSLMMIWMMRSIVIWVFLKKTKSDDKPNVR